MKVLAKQAAKEAVVETFLVCGADVSTPEGALRMQKNFQNLQAWTDSVELVKRRGLAAAATVIVTGFLGFLYAFIWKGA